MSLMSEWIDTMEDYGFDDLEESTLARLLDDAHKELCLREPWPFLEVDTTVIVPASTNQITTNGDSSINLNRGAMRLVTATGILNNAAASLYTDYQIGKVLAFVNTTDRFVLEPLRTDGQLKDFVVDLSKTGSPTHYYFVGDNLYLWPTPDRTTNLRIRFLTEPVTLNANSPDADVLWPARHDSVVLYAALSKAYFINDDPQGATMQQVMDARFQIARQDLWMKQYDRTDRMVVLDDDEFIF